MVDLRFEVNPRVEDAALNALFFAAWPGHSATEFRRRLDRGLGHVCAFAGDRLIGFAQLAWDGGAHAFLLDPTVHPEHRRQGIGRELVCRVLSLAPPAGVEWVHVDYPEYLADFYAACGFEPTSAGLIHLSPENSAVPGATAPALANERELEGRVALITGVTRRAGIGAAIARELAKAGASVFLTYFPAYDREKPWGVRDGEPELLLDELGRLPAEVSGVGMDLALERAPREIVELARARFGRVDILVNNAAHWEAGGIDRVDFEQLDRHYAVNVRASVLLCAEFAGLAAFGSDPSQTRRIINITSGQGRGPMPGEIAYAVTKAALDALTLTLSVELAGRGITVNAVDPGPTDTGWMSEQQKVALLRSSPTGRLRTPEDTARLVRYLSGPSAKDVTGRVLRVRPSRS